MTGVCADARGAGFVGVAVIRAGNAAVAAAVNCVVGNTCASDLMIAFVAYYTAGAADAGCITVIRFRARLTTAAAGVYTAVQHADFLT